MQPIIEVNTTTLPITIKPTDKFFEINSEPVSEDLVNDITPRIINETPIN